MDPRRHLARAIIPVAIATTAIAVITPSMPVAATEPPPAAVVAEEPVPTEPVPSEPAPSEPAPEPDPTAPVTVAPAPTGVEATSSLHRRTAADRLVRVARRQVGDRYVYGASGPGRFDCSGLVLYSLRHSHNRQVLRPGLRSARSFLVSFRHRDRAGHRHGHRGDLVVWGNGRHLGIYLGHGRAISALTRGVRVHHLNAMTNRFTAFLHTRLYRHR